MKALMMSAWGMRPGTVGLPDDAVGIGIAAGGAGGGTGGASDALVAVVVLVGADVAMSLSRAVAITT